MANTYWCTNARSNYALIMRTPVDPFGGAVYHSMSLDGYLSAIPGLVLLMPSHLIGCLWFIDDCC